MTELGVLVADRNIEAAVAGLLSRPESLRMRKIAFDVFVHPRHDPGCFREGVDFLRARARSYEHGLIVFDHAWDHAAALSVTQMEDAVRQRFAQSDLKAWGNVVVIDPELEAWVWSASPVVEECLRWTGRSPSLRAWLSGEQLWDDGAAKPRDPKRAVERALEEVRWPRSSSLYKELATRVSFKGCTDAAFSRFCGIVSGWFPKPIPSPLSE